MTKATKIRSSLLTAAFCSVVTTNASAHDFAAHSAITQAATSALHYWVEGGNNPATFCPTAAEKVITDNTTFRNQASTAIARLRQLRTGLAPVIADTTRCNAMTNQNGEVSGYYPDDVLGRPDYFRIADFRYLVKRDYQTGCNMEGLHGRRLTDEGWRTLGTILGTLAGDVDNRQRDTVLWIKPLNMAQFGLVKDALSMAAAGVGLVFLAPFACLWSLLSDGSCGDAAKWAHQYNPVDYAAGLVPGIPYSFTGSDVGLDINGLWHYQQTNGLNSNYLASYNIPPGLDYLNAGPNESPGALDYAILAGTSALGVSLDAAQSLGVQDFGKFDELSRGWPLWESQSLGLTEFTPLSKLAKFGVSAFESSGRTTAEYLGYPLHALADATFPQHLACTTGWGHRPLEDAINDKRTDILQFNSDDDRFTLNADAVRCRRPVEIVLKAYESWTHYGVGLNGHVDIEDMIERLAADARTLLDTHFLVWNDEKSNGYLGNDPAMKDYFKTLDYATGGPPMPLIDLAAPLAVSSAGASLAFLIDQGNAVPATLPYYPNTKCPPGSFYVYGSSCQGLGGTNVAMPAAIGVAVTSPSTAGSGSCSMDDEPCSTSAECCQPNRSCNSNGLCPTLIQ